jgi:hypothetical protein
MSSARRIALAFLYACGALSLAMLIPWWNPIVLSIVVLLAAVLAYRYQNVGPALQPAPLDLATAATILGYAFYATVARPWEWDFWAIWGLKGRVFFEAGRIDWRFLEQPSSDFTHPDYPPLLPLLYSFIALLRGEWDDRWLGLLFVAFGAALVVIVRERAARETSPAIASVVALAIAPAAVTRYVGLAEGPLIAYGTAGLLFARCGGMTHAALLLGFAAITKNEGITLIAAVIIALGVERRFKDVLRLWPALAIAAPWLLLRALHHLTTDLAAGSPLERAAEHAQETAILFGYLADYFPDRWLWLAIVAGIATTWILGRTTKTERFLVIAVAAQFAFFIAAYFVTPRELQWHVETSWERLVRQLEPAALFAALMGLARVILSRTDGEGSVPISRSA